MDNYEGRGRDKGEETTEDQRQVLQELEDLKAEHLNLPGHEKLVEKAASKIEKINENNADAARDQLADLDSMIVEAGGDEEAVIEVLKEFVSEKSDSEDDDDEEASEGWGDDEE